MGGKVVMKGGKKKKKGRPSLADLRKRRQQPPRLARSDTRLHPHHHVGHRNEEEEEEEEEKKRVKKVKLVLRLPRSSYQDNTCSKVVDQGGGGGAARITQRPSPDVTVAHPAPAPPPASSSFEEYDDGHKPLKKRKLGDADGNDDDDDAHDHDDDDHDDDDDDDDHDDMLRPDGSAMVDSGSAAQKEEKIDPAPGKETDSVTVTPLPDVNLLDFLLNKLQKKDTYGVFAEPVDPNVLPDYHDVIENPMDFGTIRKKLTGAVYSTLEQLEKDVFLVCGNAMRYNAPETIYFRQAHSIQELARKKFLKLRIGVEGIEMESKPAHKVRSNSLVKNPLKRSSGRSTQEPVGSDFSSGATLATAGDTCTWSSTTQASAFEKSGNMISFGDGSSFMAEFGLEKVEEFSGKGLSSKLGRKPFMLDENRRSTYKISDQLVGGSDSLFSIFEGETKQLISVGLHGEHAYTRSLARFAAALGPVAWRVASQRIKQALPAGLQFGRGWVGEYEPLPRPTALTQEQVSREAAYGRTTTRPMPQSKTEPLPRPTALTQEQVSSEAAYGRTTTRSMPQSKTEIEETREESVAKQKDGSLKATSSRTLGPPMETSSSGASLEGKPGLVGRVAGTRPFLGSLFSQQNKSVAIDAVNSDNNISGGSPSKLSGHIASALPSQGLKQVELSCSPSTGSTAMEVVPGRQKYYSEVPTSNLHEMISKIGSSHTPVEEDGAVAGRLIDCKIAGNPDGIRVRNASSGYVSNQLASGNHELGPIDQARLMRMLSGKVMPNQAKASSTSTMDNLDKPSLKSDESSVTTASVARSWMPIRSAESSSLHRMQKTAAASLYNHARELSKEASVSSLGLKKSENKIGSWILPPQPTHFAVGKEPQPQNRSIGFPQLAATDLSRLRGQSPWQGLGPQVHQRQKTENFPPDLNITFQLPGSPVRHSPAMLPDSQQPDLALQL